MTTSAPENCVGFAVDWVDGTAGVVEAIARLEHGLSVVDGDGGGAFVALADIDVVDTETHRISLRPDRGRAAVHAVEPRQHCACPTDLVCASCAYGVAEGHLPPQCPMCHGHRWRPARARTTRIGF